MPELVESAPRVMMTDLGDLESEFEARLRDSSTLAFRVAFSVLRNRQDAEDVAQDAFARAYRGFSQLREREAFRAWLVRTAWRLALDHRRGARRREAREQVAVADVPVTTEQTAIEAERARTLWAAIDRLPDPLRLTLVLASIEGHSMKEVATLTGVAEGTVKSRVFDAKQLLKGMLV
jgi:RNA polymerase sigma-70 factor (ECF subfamily)